MSTESEFEELAEAFLNGLIHGIFSEGETESDKKEMHTENKIASPKATDSDNSLKLFISYSHEDRGYVDLFVRQLAPYFSTGKVKAFDDSKIEPGQYWFPTIQNAIALSDVSILFVSSAFIASKFITHHELPKLFQKQNLIWFLLGPCAYDEYGLDQRQCFHDPKVRLSALQRHQIEEVFYKAGNHIKELYARKQTSLQGL